MAKRKRSACEHACVYVLLWESDSQTRAKTKWWWESDSPTRAHWCMDCGAFQHAPNPGEPLGPWQYAEKQKPKRAKKRKARRTRA
jgi:hypothetical protein